MKKVKKCIIRFFNLLFIFLNKLIIFFYHYSSFYQRSQKNAQQRIKRSEIKALIRNNNNWNGGPLVACKSSIKMSH